MLEETTFVSVLQERLLSALDALDSMKRAHLKELKTITQERDQLKEKLGRVGQTVQLLNSERDDMRDAIMRLIEKVELCNDYSKWRHSRMSLSDLAESGPTLSVFHQDNDELLSTAGATIARLRKQREEERLAFSRFRSEASDRILELEAQISRREAQLELAISKLPRGGAKFPSSRMPSSTNDHETPEVIAALELTTARNKALENEIKMLARRLEQAKAKSRPSLARPAAGFSSSHESYQSRAPKSRTLAGFEKDVQDLGQKIDLFSDERRALARTLNISLPDNDTNPLQKHQPPELGHRVQKLEEECQGLRESVVQLQEDLRSAKEDAERHERDLQTEVATIRLTLAEKPQASIQTHKTKDAQTQLGSPIDLLGEGEEPMDIATPLIPSSTMSIPGNVSLRSLQNSPASLAQNANLISFSRSLPEDSVQLSQVGRRRNGDSPYPNPPSVPLPTSPLPDGLSEWEENDNSPTLSQFMLSTLSDTPPVTP